MFEYNCQIARVVDGDTADAMIDLGFNTWVKKRIRFMGVDTWECRTRDLEEKKRGLAAKSFTKHLLEDSDEGKFLVKSHGVGKYGRVLGELFVGGGVGVFGLGVVGLLKVLAVFVLTQMQVANQLGGDGKSAGGGGEGAGYGGEVAVDELIC